MSGKATNLTPLQMRKQLLVVESELNRARLLDDVEDVKAGVAHLAAQVTTLTSLAESAVHLGATITRFFQGDPAEKNHGKKNDGEKPSWVSNLFNLAKRGVSIWQEL